MIIYVSAGHTPRLVTPGPPQMMPVMMMAPRPPMRMVSPMGHQGYMPTMGTHIGGPGPRPPIIRQPSMPSETEGPPAKKSKTEDSLMPETEFLKRHNVCMPIVKYVN